MKIDQYRRLLVLSNNSFSKSNSNGRTLGSLLQGWPKDKIAQFCISSEGADFEVCDNYFCVTDRDVLRSTITLRPAARRNLKDGNRIDANSYNGHVRHRKTTLKMFARNWAWMLGIWKGRDFWKWVEDFHPDIVLLQSGESFFMHKLAQQIVNKSKAELAVFNTEASYFFKKDFFAIDGWFGKLLFPIYQWMYRIYFKSFMEQCGKQIYGNELLRRDYDKEFGKENSIVLYTASTLLFSPKELNEETPVFSYLGTLGFERPKALKEIASVLSSINENYKLDVYGFARNKEMEDDLRSCPSIRFHGAVSYEEVKIIIQTSDFLIHAESQSEKWAESLRYGFSTKIADSISSGKIFILYCSPNIACAKYIQENGAGIFASNLEELKEKLLSVLKSNDDRKIILDHSKKIASQNHDSLTNISRMKEYLLS